MSSDKNPAEELYLEDNPSFEEIEEEIRVTEMVEEAMQQAEDMTAPIQINFTGTLHHNGFKSDDLKQKMVAYAYKLGGLDFVKLIECENGNWSIDAVGDNGKAFGLCQMNINYHKLPADYKKNRVVQVEFCYKKWKGGIPFYGPSRKMKNGQICSEYVKNRFILE